MLLDLFDYLIEELLVIIIHAALWIELSKKFDEIKVRFKTRWNRSAWWKSNFPTLVYIKMSKKSVAFIENNLIEVDNISLDTLQSTY